MSLQTKYVVASKDGYEHEYPEAILKVVKITTSNTDYEFFEKVNDPEQPDIDQRLSWMTRIDTDATVYVWSDIDARNNRAQVVHWFSFTFEYDLNDIENIYEQAYKKLHVLFKDSKDII